jgi:hypothetical protein
LIQPAQYIPEISRRRLEHSAVVVRDHAAAVIEQHAR